MSSFMCVDCSVSSAHPDFGTLDDYQDHREKCHGGPSKAEKPDKPPKATLQPADETEEV